MTLQEIKNQISAICANVDKLQEEAKQLPNASISEFLDCELGYISYRLEELANVQEDSEGNPDTDGLEDGLNEWWEELTSEDKSQMVGLPLPHSDGRGDSWFDFQERCDKWWNAKTISQKQETYKEWADELPWWEKDEEYELECESNRAETEYFNN